MLSSILKLLRERGSLSVKELSLALQVEPSALYPMLDMLVQKKKIQCLELACKKRCAGGCSQSDAMTYYALVD